MKTIKARFRDIEMEVLNKIRERVETSSYISAHTGGKAIRVEIDRYKEITVINDRLIFLDSDGYHHSIFNCDLQDLIDILEP